MWRVSPAISIKERASDSLAWWRTSSTCPLDEGGVGLETAPVDLLGCAAGVMGGWSPPPSGLA